MATIASSLYSTRPNPWGPSTAAVHTVDSPEQMTDIMSYQYPPPQANGADMTLTSADYLPGDFGGISSAAGYGQASSQMSPRERHDSMSKNLGLKLKRALSTPVVRSPSQQPPEMPASQASLSADQTALGLAEKKRNKLGYHRTSVACGHCRRRKIRCIPSAGDLQGRCINCIRLKKECSFYPVDQQPPADARKNSTSSRSSNMVPPSVKSAGTEAFSPDGKLPSTSSGRPFDYSHGGGMTNWMAAETSPNPNGAKPGDLNATWRSYAQDSPITPAFSPFTPQAPTAASAATWAAAPSQSDSSSTRGDDLGWSYPPPRSLSFGATETSNGQHPHHHHQQPQQHPQHHHHTQPALPSTHPHAQYPSISHITSGARIVPFDQRKASAGAMSDGLYPPAPSSAITATTTMPGVDSIPGTTALDHHHHHVALSAGGGAGPVPTAAAYGHWQQHPYVYGAAKPGDPSGDYVAWGSDHGAVSSSEGHVATPGMYYGGR